MPMSRREVLSLGAAVALCAAGSSCSERADPAAPAPRPRESRGRPRPSRSAFFGHPRPGELYYGASVPHHRSLQTWETSLGGSLALTVHAAAQGVQLHRVHDVAETMQALKVWRGMRDMALTP